MMNPTSGSNVAPPAHVSLSIPDEHKHSYCAKFLKISGVALGIILIVGAVLTHFAGLNTAIVLTLGISGAVVFTVSMALLLRECASSKHRPKSQITLDLSLERSASSKLGSAEPSPKMNLTEIEALYENYVKQCEANAEIEVQDFETFKRSTQTQPHSKEQAENDIGSDNNEIVENLDNGGEEEIEDTFEGLIFRNSQIFECVDSSLDTLEITTYKAINPVSNEVKEKVSIILSSLKRDTSLQEPLIKEQFLNELITLVTNYSYDINILKYILGKLTKNTALLEELFKKQDFLKPITKLLKSLDDEKEKQAFYLENFFRLGFIPKDIKFLTHLINRMLDIPPKSKNDEPLYHKLIKHLYGTHFLNNRATTSKEVPGLIMQALKILAEKKSQDDFVNFLLEDIMQYTSFSLNQQMQVADINKDLIDNFILGLTHIIETLYQDQGGDVASKLIDKLKSEMMEPQNNEGIVTWLIQPIIILQHGLWMQTSDPDQAFSQLIINIPDNALKFILTNYLNNDEVLSKAFNIIVVPEKDSAPIDNTKRQITQYELEQIVEAIKAKTNPND